MTSFKYFCWKFSRLSNEELKQGIFNGPEIHQVMKDAEFVNFMFINHLRGIPLCWL